MAPVKSAEETIDLRPSDLQTMRPSTDQVVLPPWMQLRRHFQHTVHCSRAAEMRRAIQQLLSAHKYARVPSSETDSRSERLRYNAQMHRMEHLRRVFVTLDLDEATADFLDECQHPGYWSTFLMCCLRPTLRLCMAHTDTNGLLGTGQMFLLSQAHCKRLMMADPALRSLLFPADTAVQKTPFEDDADDFIITAASDGTENKTVDAPSVVFAPHKQEMSTAFAPGTESLRLNPLLGGRSRLLDIGSGDGRVTSHLAAFFDEVVATEVSSQMVKKLRARGFTAVQCGDITQLDPALKQDGFDTISLLNVLDRCDRPFTLLKDIRKLLRNENSRLILATPLPFLPSVEIGVGKWRTPIENINLKKYPSSTACCLSWEESAILLDSYVFRPTGWRVEVVSRVPYLSHGDMKEPYYTLDDAVFVLSPQSS